MSIFAVHIRVGPAERLPLRTNRTPAHCVGLPGVRLMYRPSGQVDLKLALRSFQPKVLDMAKPRRTIRGEHDAGCCDAMGASGEADASSALIPALRGCNSRQEVRSVWSR